DVEDKVLRRLFAPARDNGRGRYSVEARVHFHEIEVFGVPWQALARRQAGRVPVGDESRISPAGRTHPDRAPAQTDRAASSPTAAADPDSVRSAHCLSSHREIFTQLAFQHVIESMEFSLAGARDVQSRT